MNSFDRWRRLSGSCLPSVSPIPRKLMCGIFGIVTTKSRSELIEPVSRALGAMAHRGLDERGVEFISDERDGLTVAFANHPLSVLDLSPAGHQPMRDEATGDWITCN